MYLLTLSSDAIQLTQASALAAYEHAQVSSWQLDERIALHSGRAEQSGERGRAIRSHSLFPGSWALASCDRSGKRTNVRYVMYIVYVEGLTRNDSRSD